ncbi:MauE/DoxX family redox-associated membrane protein [Cecembia rubra]|uniref:Methylamine utilization protein MauE n=1 Tax=Cecembia rubra TaxID=1485585 RepID=A0A2P8E0T4_9BACT|nr:MauE/DoxX family redox-associated membrane protein [Cecembia rubra]PSL03085.1 methylamine utilization protein MauE [Cecembia rubra]
MRAMYVHKGNKKVRSLLLEVIPYVLAFLFLYTGFSKLMDPVGTYQGLSNQVLPTLLAELLFYSLPPIELTIAVLLLKDRTIKIGLASFSILMTVFSAYIILVLTGVFGRVPCSCGGVLNSLGWWEHLWFNLFFLGLAGIGLKLKSEK